MGSVRTISRYRLLTEIEIVMSSLLTSHLEQISLCATSIAELPFPGPKIFTNALLGQHDITALIRDTEAHERALFHLAPPPLPTKAPGPDFAGVPLSNPATTSTSRRATVYGSRQPKNKAVAAVLGGELYQQTRKESAAARQKGEVDVEVLLEGAERLAAVYPTPGAADRIAQLRRRHQQLTANIAHYEARVSQQSKELEALNIGHGGYGDDDDEMLDDEPTINVPTMTKEDLEHEEIEIRELEQKKRSLEDRVTGMERDLGGLMR